MAIDWTKARDAAADAEDKEFLEVLGQHARAVESIFENVNIPRGAAIAIVKQITAGLLDPSRIGQLANSGALSIGAGSSPTPAPAPQADSSADPARLISVEDAVRNFVSLNGGTIVSTDIPGQIDVAKSLQSVKDAFGTEKDKAVKDVRDAAEKAAADAKTASDKAVKDAEDKIAKGDVVPKEEVRKIFDALKPVTDKITKPPYGIVSRDTATAIQARVTELGKLGGSVEANATDPKPGKKK